MKTEVECGRRSSPLGRSKTGRRAKSEWGHGLKKRNGSLTQEGVSVGQDCRVVGAPKRQVHKAIPTEARLG